MKKKTTSKPKVDPKKVPTKMTPRKKQITQAPYPKKP